MASTDVVIIGGGICGVLAAQKCQENGIAFRLIDKCGDFGGVWAFRANKHSHLQAHASLYQWHKDYPLDADIFKKCPSSTVLGSIRKFAADHSLAAHADFNAEALTVDHAGGLYTVKCRRTVAQGTDGETEFSYTAPFVFCATGILGRQYSTEERSQDPSNSWDVSQFKGAHTYAGQHNGQQSLVSDANKVRGKDVVILGSGAFGLEAMEAACRSGAGSITVVMRKRDRWIVPYSEQFKFIMLSHTPFLSKRTTATWINAWLASTYKAAGIEHVAPEKGTACNFTGQCNDAFFRLPKQGKARYVVDKANSMKVLHDGVLVGEERLHADVLVTALGCEVQYRPPYLQGLGLGYQDLHSYAFLGSSARIGTASDWVWFNVPHGPQKQVDCFIRSYQCYKAGKEQEFCAALVHTPFSGCKGESMNPSSKSGLRERAHIYSRCMCAGRTPLGKLLCRARLALRDLGVWLLVVLVRQKERKQLLHWMDKQ